MRTPRLKPVYDCGNPDGVDRGYVHCVSRTVGREYLFGEREKRKFVSLMRLYERVCCVRVVTYCVMSNHFHILLEVPRRPEQLPDEQWLVRHVTNSYGKERGHLLKSEIAQLRAMGGEAVIRGILDGYFRRMWDVSEFMKTLKQRFTQWFNKVHGRSGTIWESRFRSVLVEGNSPALLATAAYIDLNPIRAGLVEDPADYAWCGYGEAVAGRRAARRGLEVVHGVLRNYVLPENARGMLEQYRCVLYERGEAHPDGAGGAHRKSKGFSSEQARAERGRGGRLPNMAFLVRRVKYFTRGGIIGSREFVSRVYEQIRDDHCWRPRQSGRIARKMRFGDRVRGRELFALRCVP